MSGLFITFEGLDGTGKSTQVDLLVEALKSCGQCSVVKVREPGGSPFCEQIRTVLKSNKDIDPVAELLLFNAARSHLVNRIIKPALDLGRIVICDRFTDSTIAYQQYGNLLDAAVVKAAVKLGSNDLVPDATILLQVQPLVATARLSAARGDELTKYDNAAAEFKARVAFGYAQCATRPGVHVVDGDGAPAEVQRRIWACLQSKLAGFIA